MTSDSISGVSSLAVTDIQYDVAGGVSITDGRVLATRRLWLAVLAVSIESFFTFTRITAHCVHTLCSHIAFVKLWRGALVDVFAFSIDQLVARGALCDAFERTDGVLADLVFLAVMSSGLTFVDISAFVQSGALVSLKKCV